MHSLSVLYVVLYVFEVIQKTVHYRKGAMDAEKTPKFDFTFNSAVFASLRFKEFVSETVWGTAYFRRAALQGANACA